MTTAIVTMANRSGTQRPGAQQLGTQQPGAQRLSTQKTGSQRSHLRLTRRGRIFFTALAATPLVIAALVFALNGGGATANTDLSTGHFQYLTVEAGQSLWQLAESIAPNADPRDFVADLVVLNQLEGSVVHPGERLAIPTAYAR